MVRRLADEKHNRRVFGVSKGPWVGHLPHGFVLSEIARVRQAAGSIATRVTGREGCLVVYPCGMLWVDEGAPGVVTLSAFVEGLRVELRDRKELPRRERWSLVGLEVL